jgi:hypothetical protein
VLITRRTEVPKEEVPDPLEGWQIVHSDDFWHLFVVTEEQCELLSIPDDEVFAVRIPGQAPASAEDDTPLLERINRMMVESSTKQDMHPKTTWRRVVLMLLAFALVVVQMGIYFWIVPRVVVGA